MIPPVYDESDFPERLRRLLAIEIDRIVEDLQLRSEFLVEIWSRHRDRGPFLDTVFSRWRTLSLTDLAVLPTETLVVVESFYRELEDFKLYLSFTEDMPTTLADRMDEALVRIEAYGTLAIDALGGAPERPMVEFEDDAEDEADALLEGAKVPPRLEVITADLENPVVYEE